MTTAPSVARLEQPGAGAPGRSRRAKGPVLALGGGAALVALREVSGKPAARRAAPFLALAPAAVWIATSADALFAGVGAWGVALIVLATRAPGAKGATPTSRRSAGMMLDARGLSALGGGLLFGAA